MPEFLKAVLDTLKLIDLTNVFNFSRWNADVANPPTVVLNIVYGLQCVRLYWFTTERGLKTRLLFASLITSSLFMGIIRAFMPTWLPLADWLFWVFLNGAVAVSNGYLQDNRPREKYADVYVKAAHWQWYFIIGGFGILSLYCMTLYGQRNASEQSADRKALQASTNATNTYNQIEQGRAAFRDSTVHILREQAVTIKQQAATIAKLTVLSQQRALQIERLTKTAVKTSKDVNDIKGAVTHEPTTGPVERLTPKLPTVTKPSSATAGSKDDKPKKGGWLPWNWFSGTGSKSNDEAGNYALDSLYAKGRSFN